MSAMETYFAPAERQSALQVEADFDKLRGNAVLSALMNVSNGLLAVLNEQRQILSINDAYLEMLGIADPGEVLGLRVGESIGCAHSHEMPGGCGTSMYCPTCGAAIAMVTSLETNHPTETKCCVVIQKDGGNTDLFFSVRAQPLVLEGERYILIFLQDISKQQNWAALERIFFHDISNLVGGLAGACDIMMSGDDSEDFKVMIYEMATLIANEIKIHKRLVYSDLKTYQPIYSIVTPRQALGEIKKIFLTHKAATGKKIVFSDSLPEVSVKTDFSLLTRIIVNMTINALEATTDGEEVRVSAEVDGSHIHFKVWNKEYIPKEIALRVFQRNYSTKEGEGRGLGAYAMKIFGENILGGKVDFTTSEENGTTFQLALNMK